MVGHRGGVEHHEVGVRARLAPPLLPHRGDELLQDLRGPEGALMDRVDQLRAVPGVLNVLLVYHHAEPRDALEAEVGVQPDSKLAGVQT